MFFQNRVNEHLRSKTQVQKGINHVVYVRYRRVTQGSELYVTRCHRYKLWEWGSDTNRHVPTSKGKRIPYRSIRTRPFLPVAIILTIEFYDFHLKFCRVSGSISPHAYSKHIRSKHRHLMSLKGGIICLLRKKLLEMKVIWVREVDKCRKNCH